ncbi:MAG: hypothetical protein WC567_08885, partial [Kiritimatiellia bacterium]
QALTKRPPFNEVSALFPLLTIYTAAYMALMVADFALKSAFALPEGIMPVYVALLGAYAVGIPAAKQSLSIAE